MSLLRKWRLPLLVMLALAAMLAFSACSDDDDDEGGDGDATDAPAGERIDGGTLTAHAIEPQSIDPHFSSFAQDISFERMLWRGLYALDTENVAVPGMAASDPVISEDGLTMTVTLRDGLTWSDGDDLTADDFVLGIQRTCDPVNAGEYSYLIFNIAGCQEYYEALAGPDGDAGTGDDLAADDPSLDTLQAAVGAKAVDDTTVEFTFLNPWPTAQVVFSLWMTFPVPSHLLPDPSEPWPACPDAPGTLAFNGPYILTACTTGDSATLEPNTSWKEEYSAVNAAPTLDSITLRFIDDHAVAQRAYEAGELDFSLVNLPELEATVAQYDLTGEYSKLVRPSTRGLQMQMEHPPLDNLDVRMAIGKAVDWQRMIDNCYGGGHEYTTTWIPNGVPAGQPTDFQGDLYAYDVDEAKTLLEQGGGVDRSLNLVVRVGTESECAGQFIQEALRTNLGIETELEAVEGPVRSARFREETFDLFPGGWIQDYPDPENWMLGQFDEEGSLNHYNCNDPEIWRLIDEAEFNLNNEERIQQYEQANELIVTGVCGIFVYYHEAEHYLVKPTVVGMLENSTGQDAVSAGDWAIEAWGVTE